MNTSTLNTLLIEYHKKKIKAEEIAERKKAQLYEEFPSLSEIDQKLSTLALTTMKEMAKNNNKELLAQLNSDITTLKKEKEKVLKSIGKKALDIVPHYECEKCNDTGYISDNSSTQMCNCLK